MTRFSLHIEFPVPERERGLMDHSRALGIEEDQMRIAMLLRNELGAVAGGIVAGSIPSPTTPSDTRDTC